MAVYHVTPMSATRPSYTTSVDVASVDYRRTGRSALQCLRIEGVSDGVPLPAVAPIVVSTPHGIRDLGTSSDHENLGGSELLNAN
jgi:hypothetical protein